MNDPTIAAMEARNAEHERLRSEVVRLTLERDACRAMVADAHAAIRAVLDTWCDPGGSAAAADAYQRCMRVLAAQNGPADLDQTKGRVTT